MNKMNKKKSISLFLMTQKGYEVLRVLAEEFNSIIFSVVSARDLNIQKDYYDEIKEICHNFNIPFYDRTETYKLESEYFIAVSWRWLINRPFNKLIIFHDSLLSKYRGFNPLVSALINGEKQIGVTAIFASEEYDRGGIISQLSTEISYPIKIQRAIDLIIKNYKKLVLQIVRKIANDEIINAAKQNESEATYSLWRDEGDYKIDWSMDSEYIRRFVDAVGFPYSGAKATLNDKIVRIKDAEVVGDVKIENRVLGKVIFVKDSKPVVVCGKGLLKINELLDDVTRKSLLPLSKFKVRLE